MAVCLSRGEGGGGGVGGLVRAGVMVSTERGALLGEGGVLLWEEERQLVAVLCLGATRV